MLFDLYSSLVNRFPENCTHLYGTEVDGFSDIWLSINSLGHPNVLFESLDDATESDIKLKYIESRFLCHCDITLEGGTTKSGIYSIITLKEDDPDIVRVFLRLMEESFLFYGAHHDGPTIRRKILDIAELFSSLEMGLRDVVGLWGELYLMTLMSDVDKAVKAWCLARTAQFDFVTERNSIEVKSTLKSRRKHRFSLEQLRPGDGITVYIVSILLIEIASGKTVGELIDEIYDTLSDKREKEVFFRQCLLKGGRDIFSSTLCLGVYPEGESVAVFSSEELPAPTIEVGDPITGLRFDLDITRFSTETITVVEQLFKL